MCWAPYNLGKEFLHFLGETNPWQEGREALWREDKLASFSTSRKRMGGKEKATQPPFKLACPEGLEDSHSLSGALEDSYLDLRS